MKSLQTLIFSHILVSIFVTFFLVYGQVTRPFLIIFLLVLPVFFFPIFESGTKISENHIKKNTLLERISLLYPRISPTTDNEFYGLEISPISNHLYYF